MRIVLPLFVFLSGCASYTIKPFENQVIEKKNADSSKVERCLIQKGYSITMSKNGIIDTAPRKIGNAASFDVLNRLSVFIEKDSIKYNSRYFCPIESTAAAAMGSVVMGAAIDSSDRERRCVYHDIGTKEVPNLIRKYEKYLRGLLASCS